MVVSSWLQSRGPKEVSRLVWIANGHQEVHISGSHSSVWLVSNGAGCLDDRVVRSVFLTSSIWYQSLAKLNGPVGVCDREISFRRAVGVGESSFEVGTSQPLGATLEIDMSWSGGNSATMSSVFEGNFA